MNRISKWPSYPVHRRVSLRLLRDAHVLLSVARNEAESPIPVPQREVLITRDSDAGLELRELPGPARERAHSRRERAMAERLWCFGFSSRACS